MTDLIKGWILFINLSTFRFFTETSQSSVSEHVKTSKFQFLWDIAQTLLTTFPFAPKEASTKILLGRMYTMSGLSDQMLVESFHFWVSVNSWFFKTKFFPIYRMRVLYFQFSSVAFGVRQSVWTYLTLDLIHCREHGSFNISHLSPSGKPFKFYRPTIHKK